jgi:hypothetical protein
MATGASTRRTSTSTSFYRSFAHGVLPGARAGQAQTEGLRDRLGRLALAILPGAIALDATQRILMSSR